MRYFGSFTCSCRRRGRQQQITATANGSWAYPAYSIWSPRISNEMTFIIKYFISGCKSAKKEQFHFHHHLAFSKVLIKTFTFFIYRQSFIYLLHFNSFCMLCYVFRLPGISLSCFVCSKTRTEIILAKIANFYFDRIPCRVADCCTIISLNVFRRRINLHLNHWTQCAFYPYFSRVVSEKSENV